MHYVKKSLSCALLIIIMVIGFALAGTIQVSAEAPGVITIISSDTTWTKADSPHNLTGPLLVSNGVTLTIEAGVTVNLEGYELRVDGILRVIGNVKDQIRFNDGLIALTEFSTGWNEQTGTGCIIENAFFDNVEVNSNVALSIINSTINRQVSVVGQSLVWGNELGWTSITGSSIPITKNVIGTLKVYDCSLEIHENTIHFLDIEGSSFEIFNNTINGRIEGSVDSVVISDNTLGGVGFYEQDISGTQIRHLHANSATITGNIIARGICLSGESSTITNNNITGYTDSYEYRFLWGYETEYYQTPGIILSGDGYVSGNRVVDCSVGVEGGTTIEGNLLLNNENGIRAKAKDVIIRNNTITAGGAYTGISGSSGDGTVTIENNVIGNGFYIGILTHSQAVIRSNTISHNEFGIFCGSKGSAIIELNRIDNNDVGIHVLSQASITNNTIANSGTAVLLENVSSVNINFNNIEDSRQHSIYLEETTGNVDATNNWWGTADPQAINLTIHDYKYDFDLGRVDFVPFLTEPNPEEMSTPIPEFPSWLLVPLFLMATFAVVVVRKRLVG